MTSRSNCKIAENKRYKDLKPCHKTHPLITELSQSSYRRYLMEIDN